MQPNINGVKITIELEFILFNFYRTKEKTFLNKSNPFK